MIGHLIKHTLNHYEKALIDRVNQAVRDYPRHPNIISQSRVVQGYTSKETRRWTVGLLPLTSEETCGLLLLLPEVLHVAGVEREYITPFVKLLAYIKSLSALSTKPGDSAAALAVRCQLGEFYSLVRVLNYQSDAARRAAEREAAGANNKDNDDDCDGDGADSGSGDDDNDGDVGDVTGRIRWDFPKARDEPSIAEMVVNVAPLSICSTRMAEQGHQAVKFFGSKRSNHAGDRERALLDKVSMHEAVRAGNIAPSTVVMYDSGVDTRALGPIRVNDGKEFPRRCVVLGESFRYASNNVDGNATCFKGLWLDHHRLDLGSFLYVTVADTNNVVTHRIGMLDAVIERDDDEQHTLILLELYVPTVDCAITKLPVLARQQAYEYVKLVGGVVVKQICVTNFGGVRRWNEHVPPVVVDVGKARRP